MVGAKILVIDDEPEICAVTKSFLEKKNYLCFTAISASEALGVIQKEHPRLVLLDLCLGSESGLKVLEKIKALDRDTKVIVVSGLGDEATVQEAKKQGADDFISKPFTADFLHKLVESKLG